LVTQVQKAIKVIKVMTDIPVHKVFKEIKVTQAHKAISVIQDQVSILKELGIQQIHIMPLM